MRSRAFHSLVVATALTFGLVAAQAEREAPQRGAARQNQAGAGDLRPQQGALRPGDLAPDFTLAPRDSGPPVTLSSFRGKSPIALVFGSYT